MVDLGNLISTDDVAKWFKRKNTDDGKLEISISINKSEKISISGIGDEFEVKIKQEDEIIKKALFASGLFDMRLSITKNGTSKNIATDENNFEENFFQIVKEGILVPDTNFLIDHTLSALNFILQNNLLYKIRVMIPRLSILELEKIGNKDNTTRKKGMFGFAEVMNLRTYGASLLGLKLQRETHEGFSGFAGGKFTDSWIRREIHDLKDTEVRFGYEDDVIFCTSDQINSLSAIAENIDTVNITKHENYGIKPRFARIEQLSNLTVSLSIFFDKIDIKINKDSGILTGMWEGKSNTDWIYNKVFYKSEKTT